jgi:hypothetical protein
MPFKYLTKPKSCRDSVAVPRFPRTLSWASEVEMIPSILQSHAFADTSGQQRNPKMLTTRFFDSDTLSRQLQKKT